MPYTPPCISVANTVVLPNNKPILHPKACDVNEAMWGLACVFNLVPTDETQNRDLICFFQMLIDSWSSELYAYGLHRYMTPQYAPVTNAIKDTQDVRMKFDQRQQSLTLQLFNTTDPLMQKRVGPTYSFSTDDVIHQAKIDKMEICAQTLIDLLSVAPANHWHKPQRRNGDKWSFYVTYTLNELAHILIERDPEIEGMRPASMKTALKRLFEDDHELSDRYLQPDNAKPSWAVLECDIPTIERQTIIKQVKERYKTRNTK